MAGLEIIDSFIGRLAASAASTTM